MLLIINLGFPINNKKIWKRSNNDNNPPLPGSKGLSEVNNVNFIRLGNLVIPKQPNSQTYVRQAASGTIMFRLVQLNMSLEL